MVNILSVDVEDYFHPTEVESSVPRERWSELDQRVGESTSRLLDLLAEYDTRATFFVLGWVAERNPLLVRRIVDAGHEVGCHSYWHRLVYRLSPDEFREDTMRASEAIAHASGRMPTAYRAPSYSITSASMWALDVLAGCGFTHDSSIYPVKHDRYGYPGFNRFPSEVHTTRGPIIEVPPATASLLSGRIMPVGGGGFLRLLPYRFTAAGLRSVNHIEGQAACIYVHPWEFDPSLPRLARGAVARVRTYAGLGGMDGKLRRLLTEFRFAPMREVVPASSGIVEG